MRYEGPKASKEQHEYWINYNHKFHFSPELPESAKYRHERDSWIRNKYLKYRKVGARFGLNLHSTERGRLPDDGFDMPDPPYSIGLRLEHHFRARKMPPILESYKPLFNQLFSPDHHYYYGPQEEPHSEIMTLELFNEPKYVRKNKAEDIVRHFLGYMVSAVSRWNSFQQDYKRKSRNNPRL